VGYKIPSAFILISKQI
jgi:hypothetical protein